MVSVSLLFAFHHSSLRRNTHDNSVLSMTAADEKAFKVKYSLAVRKAKYAELVRRYPDQCLIVCETVHGDATIARLLIPRSQTMGQFKMALRKNMAIEPTHALVVFVRDCVPPNTVLIQDLVAKYRDEDGFLYMKCGTEHFFGTTSFAYVGAQ